MRDRATRQHKESDLDRSGRDAIVPPESVADGGRFFQTTMSLPTASASFGITFTRHPIAVVPRGVLVVSSIHRNLRRVRSAALAAVATLALVAAGCQTPHSPATVAPPATGMIGQPAAYGSWATPPQGAAYPPVSNAPPLPGPATQWQGAAPAAPANSWSWSQPAAPTMSQPQPPSLQQYGNQLQNSAQQYQQGLTNQTQQFANQLQQQPQQYANQMQQQLANQQQQLANQTQATMNQYQQGLNNQWQQMNNQLQGQTQQAYNNLQQQGQQLYNQGQQALGTAQQQVTAQMPQMQPTYQQPVYQQPAYPQQPAYQQPGASSWNPFATSATSLPPARSTPLQTVPRY